MKKIMIVEDNLPLGTAITTVFEKKGYKIDWAQNSDQFFAKIDKNTNIIFLDINLPGGMDGFEILRDIKEHNSEYRHIPVVMLTNVGDIQEMDKATSRGADDYIIKSNIKLNELVEYVDKIVGRNE